MRKRNDILSLSHIVKIVALVCVLGSGFSWAADHILFDVLAERLASPNISQEEAKKVIQSRAALGGFVDNNPSIATQIATVLKSGNETQRQLAEKFFDYIGKGDINNALGSLNSIAANKDPGAASVTVNPADVTKFTQYLTDAKTKTPQVLTELSNSLKAGLPVKQTNTNPQPTKPEQGQPTGGNQQAGQPTPSPTPTADEKRRQAEEDELRRLQGLQALQSLQNGQNGGQGGGKGGGGGGGGGGQGGGKGGGGGGTPPSFGGNSNDSNVGNQVQKHTEDQKSKEAENPRNFAGNNNFGNNNNSSNSNSAKDPFKKDDKDGGFKLPEPKSDKNATKNVSKTGSSPKADALGDPSGDLAQGPGVGYKNDFTLSGPSKVPGLAPKPNAGAMLGAVGGGGGGGGGDNPFAGANVKGGGGGGAASFEGNPFNSNEGMAGGPGMPGAAFRKISPESGAGTDGESVEASPGGSSNDFRKKGTILDQILTLGPSDEERMKNLGIMAFVSRKERICTIPGKALLPRCSKSIPSRRNISVEEDE